MAHLRARISGEILGALHDNIWFTVLSNKELLLKKKQSKHQFTSVNKTQKSQSSENSKSVKTGAPNGNREELDFMFEEEIDNVAKKNSNKMNSTAIFSDSASESNEYCNEMHKQEIFNLIIITRYKSACKLQAVIRRLSFSSGQSRRTRPKLLTTVSFIMSRIWRNQQAAESRRDKYKNI